MYYTSKPIRLVSKLQTYLEFIQQANNRYEDKRSTLARYDACKSIFAPVKLMNKREDIISQMERWQSLSFWLVSRMQNVLIEINEVNIRQAKKELETIPNDEIKTIEL